MAAPRVIIVPGAGSNCVSSDLFFVPLVNFIRLSYSPDVTVVSYSRPPITIVPVDATGAVVIVHSFGASMMLRCIVNAHLAFKIIYLAPMHVGRYSFLAKPPQAEIDEFNYPAINCDVLPVCARTHLVFATEEIYPDIRELMHAAIGMPSKHPWATVVQQLSPRRSIVCLGARHSFALDKIVPNFQDVSNDLIVKSHVGIWNQIVALLPPNAE